jgi:hypothetical protein
MIVALIALLIALSGTAVAASGLINGSKIKNGTITGQKLKKHTLTGTQINLAKLGTVPSAAAADHAASAGTATTAATAGNASELGGLASSAFVHGGGRTFQTAVALPEPTASAPVLSVSDVVTFSAGCGGAGGAFSATNDTGVTMDESYTGTDSSTPISGGVEVAAGDGLGNQVATEQQIHYVLSWKSGSTVHTADFEVAGFQTTGPVCHMTIEGIAN